MTLLDAYGLVALVADEPGAAEVERLVKREKCHVLVVNLAEAVDMLQRSHGLAGDDVHAALEPLFLQDALTAVVSGKTVGWAAAELRTKHYNAKTRALSLADCFLLAHAIATSEEVATSDPALAATAREEDVRITGLPDRKGARP